MTTYTNKLQSKGQVAIPSEIRERLSLEPGDTVICEIEGGRAVLRRAEPFDAAYHAALSDTLDEWTTPEDDEAFRDL